MSWEIPAFAGMIVDLIKKFGILEYVETNIFRYRDYWF